MDIADLVPRQLNTRRRVERAPLQLEPFEPEPEPEPERGNHVIVREVLVRLHVDVRLVSDRGVMTCVVLE